MRERRLPPLTAVVALACACSAAAQTAQAPPATALPEAPAPATFERVTFAEAVRRAVEHHPTVGQAAQAILRTQALLDQAKSVFRPTLYGNVGATILDDARGFNGFVTQPRTQAAFNATLSYRCSPPRAGPRRTRPPTRWRSPGSPPRRPAARWLSRPPRRTSP